METFIENLRTGFIYFNLFVICIGFLIFVPLIINGYKILKEKEKLEKIEKSKPGK